MQVSQCDSDLLRSGNGLTAEGGCGQATSFKRWRPFGPNAVTGWIGNTLGGGLGEKMHHENVLAKMEVFLFPILRVSMSRLQGEAPPQALGIF